MIHAAQKFNAAPKFPFTLQAVLAMVGLVASLGLGACGRSADITDPLASPGRDGALGFGKGGVHGKPSAPDAPVLSSPANGATGTSVAPTLTWNASAGANSYRVQVATNSAFSSMIQDLSGISTTSTSVSGLSTSTQYFWRVNAKNAGGTSAFSAPFSFTTGANGTPPPPPPPPSANPCASLSGLSATVNSVAADVVQFRTGRLRIEVQGDVTAGTIHTLGPCTASDAAAVHFTSGTGNVFLAGSTTSVTASGNPVAFGALLFPGAALEPGVVLATDASGNVLEIIWPELAGLPAGPPILRLQLSSWDAAVQTGVSLDVAMTFTATAPDGTTATFTVNGRNMVVPAFRL